MQTLFTTEADLLPDYNNKILNIQIHNLSKQALDLQLDKLIIHLNSSEMKYLGSSSWFLSNFTLCVLGVF